MASLIEHIEDPSLPEPDITGSQMLEDFTFGLLRLEFRETGKRAEVFKSMYRQVVDKETGNTGVIINGDIRALLFSDISRAHLERMLTLVEVHLLTNSAALKEALSSDAISPLGEGII